MLLRHAIGLLTAYSVKLPPLTGVWTVINITGLITLYLMDYLSLEGLLIVELVSETGAYLFAILYFVLSNRKINGTPFWESQGAFIAIMNVVIITVVIYPFIAVWFEFISGVNDSTFYWIGAISTLTAAIVKKFSILQMVVKKVNSKAPKKDPEPREKKEKNSIILQSL
ncbi:MAG: hypothetical protein MK078_12080 [Crocinitomicaceae bacterium]|nr:hypothetical protein [Crocinitomicaceae bacterium]